LKYTIAPWGAEFGLVTTDIDYSACLFQHHLCSLQKGRVLFFTPFHTPVHVLTSVERRISFHAYSVQTFPVPSEDQELFQESMKYMATALEVLSPLVVYSHA